MNVEHITTNNNYGSNVSQLSQEKRANEVRQNTEKPVAVYEQGNKDQKTNKTYQQDSATVKRLIEEAEKRSQDLRALVEKMLLKQGQTIAEGTNIYGLLREGKVQVDPEVSAQAQKDIGEDGYWGVVKTAERLVSFAKALTGGDPSKADLMIGAVKKGFEEATKTWGGELPGICKDTMDTAIKQLEEWRDSINGDSMQDC